MGGDISDNLLQALLQDLQGGFFRLDAQGRFAKMDDAVRALLQVDIGEEWPQICFEREAARAFLEEAKQEGIAVSPRTLLLCRRKGNGKEKGFAPFWARVYLIGEHDASGQFQGWRGYMRDVTAEEVQARVEHLPVGFYILRRDATGIERVVYASRGFAELYGFPDPEDALGENIQDLFLSKENYLEFLEFLRERGGAAGTHHIIGWKNEVRGQASQSQHVTADITWEVDEGGNIRERWGILRDVQRDEFFATRVHDYAVVLHTYSSALIGTRHALDVLKDLMAPDPFKDNTPALADEAVEQRLDDLARRLKQALRAVVAQARERQLQAGEIDRFQEYIERLDHIAPLQLAWRITTYIDLASRVLHHTQRLREKRPSAPAPWFSRELLRHVRVAAWDLARIASLVIIYQTEAHLLEVDHEIRAFRDFWTEPFREHPHEVLDLIDVLNAAMVPLEEFARMRGVHWRRYGIWPERALVRGNERMLRRAFGHLLHNAIKYSWQRARGTWIGIRITSVQDEKDRPFWQVDIENYGVAIAEDELDDAIYQFGYRGRYSNDRNRPGTGIGLYDARQVFAAHGGSLTLSSRPAVPTRAEEILIPETRKATPHLTTATVRLPRVQTGGDDVQ